MFEQRIARPKTKALCTFRPASGLAAPVVKRQDRISHALLLQREFGNRATLRILSRQVSETTSPDAGPQALESGGAGAVSATTEQPIFNPTSPVPDNITADTAQDFVAKANAARGGSGEVAHMQAELSANPEFDEHGKIVKVNLTLSTSIVRPRWAGGRPTDQQRAAIAKAEQLIQAHEERHRDIARDFAGRIVKALHGKTETAAKQELARLEKAMDQAQNALDHREGCLTPIEKPGANGVITVDVVQGPAPCRN